MPLLGQAPEAARSQASFGPLGTSERNPLYRMFYVPVPGSPIGVRPGGLRTDIAMAYSNIFERGETPRLEQLFDLERLTTSVTVGYGLTARVEVGARLALQTSWGGFLDPMVEGLHRFLGVSNGDRASESHNQYSLYLRTPPGDTVYRVPARGLAAEDLQVYALIHLATSADGRWNWAVRPTLKLPTGADGLRSASADLAFEALLRRSSGPWHLHGLLGAATLSPPSELQPWVRSRSAFGSLGLERSFGPRLSGLVQATGGTAYLEGVGNDELDDAPLIVAFGMAGRTAEDSDWHWRVAFVEDIPPNGPSADFTIHVQLTKTRE